MAEPRARLWAMPLVGLMAGLGQAPFALPMFFLPGLLVLVWVGISRPRHAAWAGWLWGAGYFGLTLHWIVEPFLVDLARHGWMAPFALILMAGGMALFPASGAAFGAWLGQGGGRLRRAVSVAAGLAGAEALRAFILTGFPWVDAAQAMVDTPLAYLLPIGGPRLVTLALLLLLAALLSLRLPWALFGAAAIGAVAMVAGGLPPVAAPSGAPVVRLVQPNAPQDQKWDPQHMLTFYDRQVALTEAGPKVDLIIWPEMALPWLLESGSPELTRISYAAQGAPVVVGLPRAEGQTYYNSLIVIGPEGEITDGYDKRHLVPFGEYIPLGELLGRFGLRGLAVSEGGGFAPGNGPQLVSLPKIGLARPLICYEGVFAEEIATDTRPQLLMLLTNDAWFGRGAGPLQHLVQARLRAIEQGLPMVRVANTGVSAVIDAHGTLIKTIPFEEAGAADAPLPAAMEVTPYVLWGEWPVFFALLFMICALLARKHRDSLVTI